MKRTYVDADGNVTCPKCGAKNSFTSKRSGKAKVLGVATVGVGAVATVKRLQCQGCGTYLKTGGSPPPAGEGAVDSSSAEHAVRLRMTSKAQNVGALSIVKKFTGLGFFKASEVVGKATTESVVVTALGPTEANDMVAALRDLGAEADVLPNQANTPVTSVSPEIESTPDDIPSQIAKLAELHDAGILTSEEFDAKKTELLRRM
ncbi:MAG: SHOCT domain-containing protein [Solirubrobacterales bacterium]|nr:SHOCT domain-containing protein [Solirubrobacterales bacterium]